MTRIPNALSIAGSDPSGGAGVQADLKTFSALRCYGMAAITALTAQNTQGVSAVHVPPAAFVGAQIDAIFADIEVHAVKIGMLATAEIVAAVAERLAACSVPVVLDPVLVATSGDSLGAPDVADAMIARLLPLAALVTPNLPEIARLADMPAPTNSADMRRAADALIARGARAVLVKGGHLDGGDAFDLLVARDGVHEFSAARIVTRNTHGTGCTLSAAIAAHLAHGLPFADAVRAAKAFLTGALAAADDLDVGRGHGPVHHFHALWR